VIRPALLANALAGGIRASAAPGGVMSRLGPRAVVPDAMRPGENGRTRAASGHAVIRAMQFADIAFVMRLAEAGELRARREAS
jgi:hypothetical protein